MIWGALICCIPLGIHILNDRKKGDRKKTNDIIVLTIVAVALALVIRWLFDKSYTQSLSLMFGIHFLVFDYWIVYELRKSGVIRADAKIFEYTGSGKIDQIWAKVHPVIRIAVRALVFLVAVSWYLAT